MSGALTLANGGTGATTSAGAYTNIVVPKVYDSGWFAATNGGTYTKTHGLNTDAVMAQLYYAVDNSGTNMSVVNDTYEIGLSDEYGGCIQSITSTTLVAQAGQNAIHCTLGTNGVATAQVSGFYRVLVLALA